MQSKGTALYCGKSIAEHLGIPCRHVYAMADAGRLPTFRSGATICSTVEVLDEWRRAREAEAQRSAAQRSHSARQHLVNARGQDAVGCSRAEIFCG